ncbi:MAG TPA: hypothetical protein ENG87_02555 [Candidatus Pacearchaeota archaeon]|nr:hypothetical protein BMS3Abin17_00578 [archaeon BMS3Abin17]HDK42234.1 hypothetical protein [Candidatus Pacearchaeota archaeon]HDZ60613.1 hypothetical protein [Candidatus Pacearchaeota archaeon]
MIFGKKEAEERKVKKIIKEDEKKINVAEIKRIAEKLSKCEPLNPLRKYLLFSVLIASILILVLSIYLLYVLKGEVSDLVSSCGDKTPDGACSLRKPYFCSEGVLVENAINCGCPENLTKKGNSCISKYQNNSKNITLKYLLRGEESEINFLVYEDMANYLSGLPKTIHYGEGETPSRSDFKFRNINEAEQRELLLPLVTEIQNIANTQEDQMRIAISLVQNIPFGGTREIYRFANGMMEAPRYPYEVLYDERGVCGEKSELLTFLLREIGYGVVIFYYPSENHESVGIKCPKQYSLKNTSYCFIETTGPAIITDNGIEYSGGIKLTSQPEMIILSNGDSLKNDLYEYDDAKDWGKIRDGKAGLFLRNKYSGLKKKYGLVEHYNI